MSIEPGSGAWCIKCGSKLRLDELPQRPVNQKVDGAAGYFSWYVVDCTNCKAVIGVTRAEWVEEQRKG